MKPYRGFADLIRRRRKELGLTLSDVAERTGWSVPYVSELERGVKQPPPAENLRRLAVVLKLSHFKVANEAELSRRSISIDLEGASKTQRYVALLLARRFERGMTDDEAEELLKLLEQYGSFEENDDL